MAAEHSEQLPPAELMSSPFPETADIETSSSDYARRFSGKIGRYFLDVQEKMIFDLLRSWPNATVLDVGGGHGQITIPLVKNGFKVTVVGSSEVCKKRLDLFLEPDSFRFHCCNILELPFEKKSFDIVSAFRLVSHVNRWRQLLAEMCRVARKAVIIDYPDLRSFNFASKYFLRAKKQIEGNTRPFRCFHRSEILREFAKHRFSKPLICPQFFVPMVLHRAIGNVRISRTLESISRLIGLTHLVGSPVILRVVPKVDPVSKN